MTRPPTPLEAQKPGAKAKKAEQMERVWELRLAGVSTRTIARELGCSQTWVMKLYKQSLEEHAEQIREHVDKYVGLQVEQYDRIILSHWSRRADPAHAGIIMRAMESKAKLLGLNVLKVEHSGSIEHSHESEQERATRLMRDAADEIAAMTPEQLAAEAAALSQGR